RDLTVTGVQTCALPISHEHADPPQARMTAFMEGLAQSSWHDGRNLRIDLRWATTNDDEIRRHAAELVALAPDVILAATGTATVRSEERRVGKGCRWRLS